MKTAIIVDLDGTLCDSSHREHLAVNKEWDEFHNRCFLDEPYGDVTWLLEQISLDHVIIGLTGRNERYRGVTKEWLDKWGIQLDELLMRPDDDYTSDHVLKPDMLAEWRLKHPDTNIAFILEDRDKVVEAFRNLGYNVWQVRPGGY